MIDSKQFQNTVHRFIELYGDRTEGIGDEIHGGLAWVDDAKFVLIAGGEVLFFDPDKPGSFVDITRLGAQSRDMRMIRGGRISIIFQEPMTSLSPLHTIADQISEALHLHRDVDKATGLEMVADMLHMVGFPEAKQAVHKYPFELSGGLRQRAMIAMALICRPALLIADEPTTALDVTIQAQILDLIAELMEDLDLSVIMISHDLGVVASLCRRVLVMYAGQVVEDAAVARLFSCPAHPYTQGLLSAVPHPGRRASALAGIPGTLPNLYDPPPGCRFQDRCPHAMPGCARGAPLVELGPGQRVACLLHGPAGDSRTKDRTVRRDAGVSDSSGAGTDREDGRGGSHRGSDRA